VSRFRRVGRRPRAGIAGAAATILLGGCGVASGTGSLTPDAPSTMTVSSAAFSQGALPQHFTCHGGKISPPLDWTDRLFWVALSRAWSRWRDVLIIVKLARR